MILSLLFAAAVTSNPGARPPVVAGADAGTEKMICKRIDDSSSRIASGKVCLTQSQWDEMARDNRQEWEDRGSTGR